MAQKNEKIFPFSYLLFFRGGSIAGRMKIAERGRRKRALLVRLRLTFGSQKGGKRTVGMLKGWEPSKG